MIKTALEHARKVLEEGGLVIVPTDTVYGIIADAGQSKALKRVYQIKKRALQKALTIFIREPEQIDQWAKEISDEARELARLYWPGALTIVLEKQDHVSDQITANLPTIGLRIPNNDFLLSLLDYFPKGLASTSANISGEPAARKVEELPQALMNAVDLVLDGGECEDGIASTVIDARQYPFQVLREGRLILNNSNNKTIEAK